ncbi:50S ribosomal protein L21e [archaeon]|jgi:large subunit ribosomal protein L21e|nr:50S ribosomal protein L21e [archaeon]MBT4648681.1 50S ribosomal protein L21e [archaeon]MBT6821805.1 50S ribosomal protein L21e [archaeon]MBT7393079.1 50S ribosomal protein L21e [archaeon]
MKHHGGFRRKTRHKLQKDHKSKGKISLSRFFQEYENGDRVVLKAEPAYHKGMYYPRFHGRSGVVSGKRGDCYEVIINDKNKVKMIVVHPIHIKKSTN